MGYLRVSTDSLLIQSVSYGPGRQANGFVWASIVLYLASGWGVKCSLLSYPWYLCSYYLLMGLGSLERFPLPCGANSIVSMHLHFSSLSVLVSVIPQAYIGNTLSLHVLSAIKTLWLRRPFSKCPS